MRSHSVSCHPTQVNALRLNPSQISRCSIYLPRRDGRLSWPSCMFEVVYLQLTGSTYRILLRPGRRWTLSSSIQDLNHDGEHGRIVASRELICREKTRICCRRNRRRRRWWWWTEWWRLDGRFGGCEHRQRRCHELRRWTRLPHIET